MRSLPVVGRTTALSDAVSGRVIVQGITGRTARRHLAPMQAAGTLIVGGVAPGRGRTSVESLPVFDTVAAAVAATGADSSVAFLPPEAVPDGIREAAEGGISLCVVVTEGAEPHDARAALEYAALRGMRVIGPNTAGMLVPGRALLGFLPARFAMAGSVAVLSRSGTLSYEAVSAMTRGGVGQSIWIGVGGDLVKGSTFAELLPLVASELGTRAVVLLGEVGGRDEQDAARVVGTVPCPVYAMVVGRFAPRGVSLGHAGAIVEGDAGTYTAKVVSLRGAGVTVCDSPDELVGALVLAGMTSERARR